MSERGAEPHSSSPGARLAIARAEAGLSATQAAERLHLDARTLEALESGRFEELGASVFVRGHLRRYAELVGVPEAEIMASYDAWSGRLAAQPDLRDVITAPAARSNARSFELRPRSALIGAIVLVPVALIWWAIRMPADGRRAKARAVIVVPSAVSPTVSPAVSPAVVAAAPTATAPAKPVAAVPATVTPVPPTVAAVPATVAAVPPVAKTSTVAQPVTPAAPALPEAPLPPAPTSVQLVLTFTHDSWVEVYDANGHPLYHGLARSDSLHRVAGSAPLRLFLGNPIGVNLELDGRPVELIGTTPASKPQHFSIDGSGRVIDVRRAQPRVD
jgi:cytoskeleton protein RodZ